MRFQILTMAFCVAMAFSTASFAQQGNASQDLTKRGAIAKQYKVTKDSKGKEVTLNLYIFNPANHQSGHKKPAIVFFFGGGWNSGSPNQFAEHCKYLASRGMVAITADYRVRTRQGTNAQACVSDGKSAIRWVRENAMKLGIDPNRLASGGGSAGGHVAACTGVIPTLDEPTEDKSISSVPNAMVLFNPALVLASIEGRATIDKAKLESLEKRVGAPPKTISPYHHVKKGAPPTIIFHGKADKTVPYQTAEAFAEAMKKSNNECQLCGYEKQGHGFFNYKRKNGKFKETVEQMDNFLVQQGFLPVKESQDSQSK